MNLVRLYFSIHFNIGDKRRATVEQWKIVPYHDGWTQLSLNGSGDGVPIWSADIVFLYERKREHSFISLVNHCTATCSVVHFLVPFVSVLVTAITPRVQVAMSPDSVHY